jgi:hypothetical protein
MNGDAPLSKFLKEIRLRHPRHARSLAQREFVACEQSDRQMERRVPRRKASLEFLRQVHGHSTSFSSALLNARLGSPRRAAQGHLLASQISKSLYLPLSMKTFFLVTLLLAALATSAFAADAGKTKAKKTGKVKHMVAFKFKEGTSQADIDKLNAAFKDLKKKIDVIRSFDQGVNHSPEKLNKGFTNGYLLTFETEEDRNTYLEHPAHKEFGAMAMKMLADVFVLDFTSSK